MKAALKSSIFLFFLEQLCYFNLSPQGDGNHFRFPFSLNSVSFQLIPARGRKRKYPDVSIAIRDFNLSPQGDGNLNHLDLTFRRINFNLSPQGDGNRFFIQLGQLDLTISTYPRKTLSGAARQLSRRESFSSCRYPVLSSPFRGSWHGVSRD